MLRAPSSFKLHSHLAFVALILTVVLTGPALAAEPLAAVEGPNGVRFEITELSRGECALTLQGRLVNEGTSMYSAINALTDPAIERRDPRHNPNAMSGVYVVDQEAGKRAGPLFSDAGACLCSDSLGFVQAGESQPVFAKFPLPEGSASELDVVLPGFLPAEGVPIGEGS